ncbi:hypothetical protein FSOLCH5_010378 [Fusarium solani]|uniref:Uncharacterized protein n=2 Tax=Fusarium solani species complex TaxID=232080 RepID=A0A9P9KMQ8_FUSSL|nr:uncharacterized protein B0J15DRAFT_262230 [Fusarium solani]XP_052909428.1 hypothetical protein NCS57_01132200 [Fusarium keratoplasticum]KAI8659506.1 hypothetical protein NCS56_01167900 [Fusarium sp. Ph1]KAH7264105.1 hypothetical protein B0J15DRAFT_262230 [Fusarium solani]KAI8657540.1 hypothetical protein NCS57_01132200 [Fusarium keratoplasticum]KAI8658506.1 hypothetical protein NCS55_01127000 [Fusarium keratoplasticum]KAJ3458468.1 hypothetical protein MRS44_012577 [Fusarium solani]
MSDRSRAATNGNGVSRTRNGTSSSASASVRRNLFQSQLTRRPTAGSSSTSAETLHLDVDVLSDTSEIVVRDKHGEIELGDPPTPMLEDDDDVPLDHRQETEKERQRLAEAVKHHQINRNTVPEQPEELLEAVKTSLRAKVAALAEDNWMFEPEEQPRG